MVWSCNDKSQQNSKRSHKSHWGFNEQHKKDLNSLQDDYEKKLKKKDGIISELKKLLIGLLNF